MFVYLDNSSTTKPYRETVERMVRVLDEDFGNPSSLHTLGFEAEKYVKTARKAIAQSLNSGENEIYFTSCGTEADNTAIMETAQARRRRGKKIITTAVEHPAVLEAVRRLETMGFQVEYIGVDRHCRMDMNAFKEALSEDVILVSVMAVNNETGTIMPVEEISHIKDDYNKKHGCDILLHVDAVQAYAKIPLNVRGAMQGVDMMSLSGHKIHGPKGIGVLYVKRGLSLPPFMLGGGQESGMRSGTENTPGIAGFGCAADIAFRNYDKRIEAMKKAKAHLLDGIKAEISDIVINSPEDDTASPSVLNVSFMGTRGEVLLHALEQEQVFVSTGSACSSNKKGQSHVLSAMGLSGKEIEGALRFSFSEFNTKEEMEYVTGKLKQAVQRFRRLGSFR